MRSALILSFLGLSTSLFAAEEPKFLPGDSAPEIKVTGWLKGGLPEKGRFKVVEFWATWCGPCIQSIPHVTKLAKEYKGKVDFVGVSVWERGTDIKDQVTKFVAKMGDNMDYNVAYDTEDTFMAKNWMTAADRHGIPSAFIIDSEGKMIWEGHPMELDQPLKDALAGKIDTKVERAKALEASRAYAQQNAGMKELGEAIKLYNDGKTAEAEKMFDAVAGMGVRQKQTVQSQRLALYVRKGSPKRNAFVDAMVKGTAAEQSMVAQIMMSYTAKPVTRPGVVSAPKPAAPIDTEFARTTALALCESSNDAIALYYVGQTLLNLEENASATKAFDKALTALENDSRKEQLGQFKTALTKARDLAKQKTGK